MQHTSSRPGDLESVAGKLCVPGRFRPNRKCRNVDVPISSVSMYLPSRSTSRHSVATLSTSFLNETFLRWSRQPVQTNTAVRLWFPRVLRR